MSAEAAVVAFVIGFLVGIFGALVVATEMDLEFGARPDRVVFGIVMAIFGGVMMIVAGVLGPA